MHNSRYAEDIHCPKCKNPFDDNQGSSNPHLRVPVKLVPCSHTVCRPCIRLYYNELQNRQQQEQQNSTEQNNNNITAIEPQCPLCSTKIEVTQFDEAALTLVRSAQIELLASNQQQQYNPNNYSSSSNNFQNNFQNNNFSSSSSGPLNPHLRQEILAKVTKQEDAPRAEQVARGIGSLKRAIDFAKTEFDAAREERDAANDTAETKQTVVTSLQNELKSLDEKIKQMNLDRQVILHQLQNAISEQSNSVRYRTECEMRLLDIQRRIQAEATELENRISVIQQLAPGVNLY